MDSPEASYKNYLLTINHLPMYLVLKNLWMRVRQRHWRWTVRSGGVASRDPPLFLAFLVEARQEFKEREVVSEEDNKLRRMQSQSHRRTST